MNVNELYRLGEWFDGYYSELLMYYKKLADVLRHNANQQNQQTVEEPLSDLVVFLRGMKTSACSRQQLKVLEDLGVRNLVGANGASFVQDTVRRTTYDPATASAVIDTAVEKIQSAIGILGEYNSAVAKLHPITDQFEADAEHSTVRIVFQSKASMRNVVDWKNYSKDWHDIIRGIALAANESPEDVQVKGAASGSLIMVLGATAAVTLLLARIVKDLTGMTNNIISSRSAWEEFKQKSLVTKQMESEFAKSLKAQREEGLEAAKKSATASLAKEASGDKDNAVEAAIEKILEYMEKGLEVDFVAPPKLEPADGDEEGVEDLFQEARDAISEYQEIRDSVLLLEDNSNDED